MKLNEIQLVNMLAQTFYKDKKVWLEVPNMGQSVDLVTDENGALTFVEVKIKNWAKALEQCKAHEIVADYIYIAIATKKVPDGLIRQAKGRGYGILHYEGTRWNISLKPEKNLKVWKPQKRILKSKLNNLKYAN